jgi:SAM-dependent methyltransferase
VVARAPGARATGCDVDAEAIAWATAHHRAFRFIPTRAEPPLPLTTGEFDLVYSISVFSHLDAPLQDRWLAELARVLAPGGTALLSVHGAHAFERFRSGEVRTGWCPPAAFDRRRLGPEEFFYVPYTRSRLNRADLPGVSNSYGLAFHGERYVLDRWSRWLEVERVVPRALTAWQDVVVARARG